MSGIGSIKITNPEQLKLAHEWNALFQQFRKDYALYEARYVEEGKDLANAYNKKVRTLFRTLCEQNGVKDDPDEAFKTGAWFMDFKHFEAHGDVYLCKAASPVTEEKKPEEDTTEKFSIQ